LDLLNVLETSRALHTLLKGPSSGEIWKLARANMPGLPDCPDDLNEIQYAKLAFESNCQASRIRVDQVTKLNALFRSL